MATTDAPKRRPLADIAADIYHLLTDAEGDVTDLGDVLDKLDLEHEDKAEAYVVVMRRLEAEQDANEQLVEHYQSRANARQRQRDNLRERLKQSMLTTNKTKLKLPTTTVWLQETTKLQLPEGWPERHQDSPFVVERRTLHAVTAGIKDALERGEQVPEAELVTNKHLRFS